MAQHIDLSAVELGDAAAHRLVVIEITGEVLRVAKLQTRGGTTRLSILLRDADGNLIRISKGTIPK